MPGAPIPLSGPPISIAAADFNGDARTDIAAETGQGKVAILLGNGLGRFAEAAGSPVPAGEGPCAAAVADIDGDGNTDLAVANSSSEDVSILLETARAASEVLPPGPTATLLASPRQILNADGAMDPSQCLSG